MAAHPRQLAETTRTVPLPLGVDPTEFLGPSDQVIRTIERGFPKVEVLVSDGYLLVRGPMAPTNLVAELLDELRLAAEGGGVVNAAVVEHAIALLQEPAPTQGTSELITGKGHRVRAKTPGQQQYLDDLANFPIVFGIGPAGTGKTYLAMAQAVQALLSGTVKRIVLTRPAVEAGENLGFLPGSATEKIDPYLRPLFDALGDLLDEGALPQLMAAGAIEIAPLAYMRGRTLNDSYIILDEAQNTTPAQMKMFLTRLGFNSRMVVTGDDSQIDLPGRQQSGLVLVQKILEDLGHVKFSYLTSSDVVRNPLVAEIIDAYSRWEESTPPVADWVPRWRHTEDELGDELEEEEEEQL